MYKVTTVYISNVPVKHILESSELAPDEKLRLSGVTGEFLQSGDLTGGISRSYEFGRKKLTQTASFRDRDAFERFKAAQEAEVPGYLERRRAYYHAMNIAINEKYK